MSIKSHSLGCSLFGIHDSGISKYNLSRADMRRLFFPLNFSDKYDFCA